MWLLFICQLNSSSMESPKQWMKYRCDIYFKGLPSEKYTIIMQRNQQYPFVLVSLKWQSGMTHYICLNTKKEGKGLIYLLWFVFSIFKTVIFILFIWGSECSLWAWWVGEWSRMVPGLWGSQWTGMRQSIKVQDDENDSRSISPKSTLIVVLHYLYLNCEEMKKTTRTHIWGEKKSSMLGIQHPRWNTENKYNNKWRSHTAKGRRTIAQLSLSLSQSLAKLRWLME